MIKSILVAAILFCVLTRGHAQPGAPDPSFGVKGIVKTDIGSHFNYNSEGRQVLTRSDGSIFILFNLPAFISKRFPDGSIDSTYGFNGYSRSIPFYDVHAALQPDGKILIVGSNTDVSGFNIARIDNTGLLDSSFGNNGIQSTPFDGNATATSVAVQHDGKIVVAGYANNSNDETYFAVARYNANGSPDSTFNSNGKVTTDFEMKIPDDAGTDSIPVFLNFAQAVAIQSDGKIVVGGYTSGEFAVARYNVNGSPDSTFDGDGRQVTDFGYADQGYSLAIQPDGKIVLAGYSLIYLVNGLISRFAVARYNPDGSLDNTFNGGGTQIVNLGSDTQLGNSVALQSNGKIVVAGYTNNGQYNDFAIARFNTNGSLDNTFDGDGILTTDINSSDDYAGSIAIQSDDRILVAGYTYTYSPDVLQRFSVTRYNKDGALDNSFDKDGKLQGDFAQGDTKFTSTAIQPDGKIVAAGVAWNGNDYDFAVARYNTDGTPDTTFSNDGKQTTDFQLPDDNANSVAIQKDGKILVAGYSNNQFAIVRYNANGTLDDTFSGDGKLVVDPIGLADFCQSVTVQSDGKILMAGYSDLGGNSDFAVVRLNADGTPDNSFSDDSRQLTDLSSGDFANAVAVQKDGKIVVAGRSYVNNRDNFSLVRYNADGSLDNTFSQDGKQYNVFGAGDYFGQSLAIQNDGKIILAGYNVEPNFSQPFAFEYSFAIARYKTNGEPDDTFDKDGFRSTHVGPYFNFGTSVAVSDDGRLAVGGSTGSSIENYAIVMYKSDGSPDSAFNNDGIQNADVGVGGGRIQGIAFAGSKLYASGYGQFPGYLGVVVRYLYVSETNAPVVSITAPANNSIYTAPATITLDAAASDANGEITSVKFYMGEALLSSDNTRPYSYTLGNVPVGNYLFTARATDNEGITSSSASIAVTVSAATNKAPLVKIISPANNKTYVAPGRITLTASASDSDGVIKNVKFYSGATLLKTDSTLPYDFTLTKVAAGNYSFVAKATDDKGLVSSSAGVSVAVSSGSNKAPSITIKSPANNIVYTAPATITVQATASDADGNIAHVKFYNGGTLLKTDSTSPYSYTLSNAAPGNYSFIAKATDNKGLANSSASVAATVSAAINKAPVVNITGPVNNAVFTAPASIVINATASDADGKISRVQFYNGETLVKTDSSSPYTYTFSNVAAGRYSITAKAADNKGLTALSASVSLSVVNGANKAPVVNITKPANEAIFTAPATINLEAFAQDADGSINKVDFYNGSTLLLTERKVPYTYEWQNVPAGSYTVTAVATDNLGTNTTSAPINVSVIPNKLPSVSIINPASGKIYTAPASISLEASASDPDGSIAKVDFYNGSTLLVTERKIPYTYQWQNVPPGVYTITAMATDNHGGKFTSSPINITVASPRPAMVNKALAYLKSEQSFQLKLSPNPARNIVNVYTGGWQKNKPATLWIISSSGVVIRTMRVMALTPSTQMDVSSLKPGVYSLKLIGENRVMYKKFVKL